MAHNQQIGQYGEAIARQFLESKGYKIVDLNVKAGFKEIDIIAFEKGVLVFCEVKTRTSLKYGEAVEAMNDKKLKNLRQAIGSYLYKFDRPYEDIRLDLVAVDIDPSDNSANIKHYKDIL